MFFWAFRQRLGEVIKNPRGKSHSNRPEVPNLVGDRDVEWGWVTSRMPDGPGNALDFGAGGGHLSFVAAEKGFTVTAVDLASEGLTFEHPNVKFLRGELAGLGLQAQRFDLIINCSVVEHVGLSGRYGAEAVDDNADIAVMVLLRDLVKPGGIMLMTVPVGQDIVCPPFHRVYGAERLSRLLDGWHVEQEQYWAKPIGNTWQRVGREESLLVEAGEDYYALGLFELRAELE